MMWQVFECGVDNEYANRFTRLRYVSSYSDELGHLAAELAEDLYWDNVAEWGWGYVSVAVNFEEMRIVSFGGENPFDGEWDEDFRPVPVFFGPPKPVGAFPVKEWPVDTVTNSR